MNKYQSELNNLDEATIKAVEDYTRETVTDDSFYDYLEEFESLRNDEDVITYLEELADELNLGKFNLTDIQAIIVAYMFINDLFKKEYTDEVTTILENVLG